MKTLLETAEAIARKAHEGQFRRDGKTPYITHPERVVARLLTKGFGEHTLAIGWLHDVLEDSDLTLDDLISQGIPHIIAATVAVLTKEEWQTYDEYLKNLNCNLIARAVKIADILDNLSDTPTEKQIIKYSKALLYLHGQ